MSDFEVGGLPEEIDAKLRELDGRVSWMEEFVHVHDEAPDPVLDTIRQHAADFGIYLAE